jgi:hypothetical protein
VLRMVGDAASQLLVLDHVEMVEPSGVRAIAKQVALLPPPRTVCFVRVYICC